MRRKIRAFTLIEVIVTMVIIAILMALIVPSFVRYTDYRSEKEVESDANKFYSAANAAAFKTYSLHEVEFDVAINKQIQYVEVDDEGNPTSKRYPQWYGRLTSGGLNSVQCAVKASDGINCDPYKGFEKFAEGNGRKQRGDAYLAKYILLSLDAFDSTDISVIPPRYLFYYDHRPAGDADNVYTPSSYYNTISQKTYSVKVNGQKVTRKCEQAGVVICYGKNPQTGVGEVIYTEYGDDRGYLCICINPKWYYTVKEQLTMVQLHAPTHEEERTLVQQNSDIPIIITVKDGIYEAPDKT